MLMKFGQFMSYSKENNLIKKFYKTAVWKLVRKDNLSWKVNFLKKSTYIRYVIAKLSKLVQISMLVSPDSFLQQFLWKFKKGCESSFQVTFLQNFFIKNFFSIKKYFVMLQKPAKFHYQTVLSSQVIQ